MNNSDTTDRKRCRRRATTPSATSTNAATTKVNTRRLPQRAIPAAAPAGAINSSARDMAQWVRLMLGNGTFERTQRLVSEKGFEELARKQVNVGGPVDYGLGWFLRQWSGHKVVEHRRQHRRVQCAGWLFDARSEARVACCSRT